MKHLIEYVKEQLNNYIIEGGQAGHMAHPFDYTDFTGNDLKDLVENLFGGKIEHMKEKLDGDNIMATMNNQGQVVFVRNKGQLNSEQGGMTVDDMITKWADNKHTQEVYSTAGRTIETIFKKLGKDYFNPDSETRKIINCECIIAGKTNIMVYATERVAFHGYHIYKKQENKKGELEWVKVDDVEGDVDAIYKAAEGIDAAKPRPNLIIKSAESAAKFTEKFSKEIEQLFANEGLNMDSSIEEWKKIRFNKLAPEWMRGNDIIFNRLFNDDKSINLNNLKKEFPDHLDDLKELDKSIKKTVCGDVMNPMDNLFLSIGNEMIDICDGFTNDGVKDKIISSLKKDLEDTIDAVKKSGSTELTDKIDKSLNRLKMLGDKFNSAEGIVFMYKGRRMKLTGSFAPINQIMGLRFQLEDKK